MKKDIDRLMESAGIDGLLVTGSTQHNPYMIYLTGHGHVTKATLIKKRGEEPVLFHAAMERDEAVKTGLTTRSYSSYPMKDLLEAVNGDVFMAQVIRLERMLCDMGLTRGKVSLYGQTDLGLGYATIKELQKRMPEVEFIGYLEKDIFQEAMITKDADEVEHIRSMGKLVVNVVSRLIDFFSSQKVEDSVLVDKDGQPITIGKVKNMINLWVAELGGENPEGTIFAIGRDAGVPHSSGNSTDLLRLGQPIVFDFYPCEPEGGYYYDFTRTWCLGYAPDEVQNIYEQVYEVYQKVTSCLRVNEPFYNYQKMVCELYEAMGHPTINKIPETEEGYVHSLGHGVGLHIHETPFSGSTSKDHILPGSVFTIEPGLYYPSRGLGVRLEDTWWMKPDGTPEILVEYPKELVIPVRHD